MYISTSSSRPAIYCSSGSYHSTCPFVTSYVEDITFRALARDDIALSLSFEAFYRHAFIFAAKNANRWKEEQSCVHDVLDEKNFGAWRNGALEATVDVVYKLARRRHLRSLKRRRQKHNRCMRNRAARLLARDESWFSHCVERYRLEKLVKYNTLYNNTRNRSAPRQPGRFSQRLAIVGCGSKAMHTVVPSPPRSIELQDGRVVSATAARREVRDEQQRKAAAERVRAAYKRIPKADRANARLQARDKRNPLSLELQSGIVKALPVALAALGGAVLVKIFGTSQKVDKTLGSVGEILEHFKNLASELKKKLGPLLWTIPLTLFVYKVLRHFTTAPPLAISLVVSALSTVVGPQLWEHIAKFFHAGDEASGVKLQSGATSAAGKLLATVAVFSLFKGKVTNSTVSEFCKRISLLDRMAAGWEQFMEWVMEATQAVVNFARERFGMERVNLFGKAKQPTHDWAARIDAICLKLDTASEDPSNELNTELIGLMQTGSGFRELYRNTSMSRHIDQYMIKATNALQPYLGAVNARNNYRPEPLALVLYGPPGIGKTYMAMALCGTLLKRGGLVPAGCKSEVVKQNIFQKGSSEYWNGYACQKCVVMDDMFQRKVTTSSTENDFMDIIRMVGSWCFPLNFADLTSKGKIFFNSRLLFGTTNLGSIAAEAQQVIQEPSAVARRLNGYRLILKPQYARKDPETGADRLDILKANSEMKNCVGLPGLEGFPWHIWEAQPHDFIKGTSYGPTISMVELIENTATELRRRGVDFESNNALLCDYFDSVTHEAESAEVFEDPAPDFPGFPVVSTTVETQGWNPLEPVANLRAVHFLAMTYALDTFNFTQKKEASIVTKSLKYAKVFLPCVVLMAPGVVGMYVVYKYLFSAVWGFLSQLLGGSSKKGVPRAQSNRPVKPHLGKKAAAAIEIQAGDPSVALNAYNNSYKIIVHTPSESTILGQILFITGQLAVQPQHFTATLTSYLTDGSITEDTRLELRHVTQENFSVTMSVKRFLAYPRMSDADADVEFIECKDLRAHRNITTTFIAEKDIESIRGKCARLDVCEVDNRSKLLEHPEHRSYMCSSLAFGQKLDIPMDGEARKLNRYFRYNADTSRGDCGGIVCLSNNSQYSGRTVIGVHVAGDKRWNQGYCNIITRTMVEKAIDHMKVIRDHFVEDLEARGISFQSGFNLPFNTVTGSLLPLGTVGTKLSLNPETAYFKTALYGTLGEHNYLPAPLKPVRRGEEIVYPMENAIRSYSSELHVYEQPWFRQALHVATRPLRQCTANYSRRIYTFEEAILGIPEEKFRAIPRGTAAGFPYVYDVRDGKKEFFGDGADYTLDTPLAIQLRERVEYVIDRAQRGIRLSHVYVDFLKDELRSEKKVADVATRLISSSPLDYTVAFRQYFGAFTTAVMSTHTDNGACPGICAYTDWDKLARKLQSKGADVFDGDFKAFDSSEQVAELDGLLMFINSWYSDGPDNERVRRVLWEDIAHSRHIGGRGNDQRHIYQWAKSNPSGNPLTTIINTLIALWRLVGCYIALTGDEVGFWDHVFAVTYGDDNVVNPDAEVLPLYNFKTVAAAMLKEYKVVYTSGRKDGAEIESASLDRATFLKRSFRQEKGYWVAPLERDSFMFTHYWCKNRKFLDRILKDNLENALDELSLHEPAAWEESGPKITSMLRQLSHEPKAGDRQDYQRVVLKRTEAWY